MNTTNAAVGVGTLVVLGRWAQGKPLSIRVVIGVMGFAIALAILPPRLATAFAWLVIVAAVFEYAPAVINASGLAGPGGSSGAIGGGMPFPKGPVIQGPGGFTGGGGGGNGGGGSW